jgi:hypothetical protein
MWPTEQIRSSTAAVVLAFVAIVLASCTSTDLLEQWQDESFKGPPLQKLLVVAVHKSDGRRRIIEDYMVSALATQGVNASASYKLLTDAVPERAALSAVAVAAGYDGVLITHQLDQHAQNRYTPGTTAYIPVVVPTLDGKFAEYWQAIYQPGYSEVETLTDYQSDVFTSAAGGRLIWTGTTRSLDLSSASALASDISRRIVPELVRFGALARVVQ